MIRMSAADYQRLAAPVRNSMGAVMALGRLPKNMMNKTEIAYAAHLEEGKAAGEILWWAFEPWKLRLAENTFLTPDFGVMRFDGSIECHEVKGFWMEDARVKIKVAASKHPFRFLAVKVRPKREGGGWTVEEFS